MDASHTGMVRGNAGMENPGPGTAWPASTAPRVPTMFRNAEPHAEHGLGDHTAVALSTTGARSRA